jgi:hypothetical protein
MDAKLIILGAVTVATLLVSDDNVRFVGEKVQEVREVFIQELKHYKETHPNGLPWNTRLCC